jgi:signal transduction histidine kinase
MDKENERGLKWFWIVALTITGITLLHLLTRSDGTGIHEFLRRLYYIPIIIAAYRFGLKGGLLASIVCGLFYAPHLLLYMGKPEIQVVNQLMEIMLFMVVGLITGLLSQTEKQQRWQLACQFQELKRMEEEVRTADRLAAVGQLAAGVAHEIRNPLGVIRAAAQLARDEKVDNPEVRESIAVILNEVDRANRVVTGLLDFARPASPDVVTLDLQETVREAVGIMGSYAASHGVALIPDMTDRPLRVSGDGELLKQAFINLIMNAVQASPPGETVEVRVLSAAGDGMEGAMVEIRDHGPGIPSEIMEKVFDPFFTTRAQGHGLGLAIVHRIVRDHGGQVRINSRPEAGTTASVWLPGKKEE